MTQIRRFLAATLPLALAACVGGAAPQAPSRGDFTAELIDLKGDPGPPPGPKGACWQADIRPAVIETISEQVLVAAETTDADGRTTPAVFATETSQRIVQDRGTVWFRAPCPADITPDFVATLQRALKARGLYLLPLTGSLDAPTRSAIRRYQRERGLDSDHLSLAAARDLGLVAAAPGAP
ncbi:peptidoglycan-binding protein [Rhodobacter sp. Har01]|uniref:peptidoglycan-binding domain-containing protein n=1 Tax=Rhodobacter sp. Har01 TaxID=2883999 RepID=UPI001D065800|nr:peptidoglycan-binding domain-containing protein [Rhodobacter sp. Har01]MCB6178846.1 peptidoglycan-binding protein [Rhodobacter sp. Har01]